MLKLRFTQYGRNWSTLLPQTYSSFAVVPYEELWLMQYGCILTALGTA